MTKTSIRITLLCTLLFGLAVVPAFSLTIPPGKDYWNTPATGNTFFTFPKGDVEALCGKPADAGWDHVVKLGGVTVALPNADTIVARLDKAVFNNGVAATRVQVVALEFKSLAEQETPCGKLSWHVTLAGRQPVTDMILRQTSDLGGRFFTDLAVKVEFQGFDSSGANIGSLFYSFTLPDTSSSGTVWSLGAGGVFRAGMDEADNCFQTLREKIATFPDPAYHEYYIADLIAQGRCSDKP